MEKSGGSGGEDVKVKVEAWKKKGLLDLREPTLDPTLERATLYIL